jgi:hypothetical protein
MSMVITLFVSLCGVLADFVAGRGRSFFAKKNQKTLACLKGKPLGDAMRGLVDDDPNWTHAP